SNFIGNFSFITDPVCPSAVVSPSVCCVLSTGPDADSGRRQFFDSIAMPCRLLVNGRRRCAGFAETLQRDHQFRDPAAGTDRRCFGGKGQQGGKGRTGSHV
ncbi:hypothetical protein, partial [Mesorhizobium sp. M7A.F.Ca.US.001.02.1.1]|uniref:hypothetical protein n=1 Tax=Mesorhizobium sp. M7A.F.Ca.US.001.02.1.1 TaxID=2496703 RepID=UPI001FE1748B